MFCFTLQSISTNKKQLGNSAWENIGSHQSVHIVVFLLRYGLSQALYYREICTHMTLLCGTVIYSDLLNWRSELVSAITFLLLFWSKMCITEFSHTNKQKFRTLLNLNMCSYKWWLLISFFLSFFLSFDGAYAEGVGGRQNESVVSGPRLDSTVKWWREAVVGSFE